MHERPPGLPSAVNPSHQVATSGGSRIKRDAATQVDTTGGDPQPGIAKRVRFIDTARIHPPPQGPQRVAFEVDTPTGRKVVHIDPTGYVARPLDLVTDPWVPDEGSRYIRKFLTYSNDEGSWFPIHRVPAVGSWAVVDENPAVMHRVHRGRPLLVWIVGIAQDIYLCSPRGNALPMLHVTFEFLRDLDRAHASSIHDEAASQPLERTARFTVKSPGSEDEGPPTHDAVYDARRRFVCRSEMKDISPGRILPGDIILVECTVVRTEDGTNVRTVSFVLNSLHWLVEKPRPVRVETQRVVEFPDVISLE
ncbi:hypothetical protein K466DRAFT_569906 [Polyporus arcularius HHB13444]|uniref:Uncharacterized protein n=1 Tax=Polyporus arcularius HHB13444 TaxID=1314778 RepID=A0A5C3NSL9_9APHY|nr:hypothetical protein K466DRAFT_569906 [Polyporus arcularius HHB13444]